MSFDAFCENKILTKFRIYSIFLVITCTCSECCISASPVVGPNCKQTARVKSGNFGHQVNSDSDLVCFIF